MSDMQRLLFQKKLREAEKSMGFRFEEPALSEDEEEDESDTLAPLAPPTTKTPKPAQSSTQK